MKHIRLPALWSALVIGVLFLAACELPPVGEPAPTGDVQTLYVGPERVPCEGVAPMECLQVRTSPEAPYELFYDEIEGFTFEPGFEYELLVRVETVADPPADASGLRYILVEVVDQAPVATYPLEGTLWIIREIVVGDGQFQQVAEDDEAFILLENGEVGGSSGCNSFFGTYMLEGNALAFGPVGATLMACPEPLMVQERALFDALEATTNFRIQGAALILLGEAGEPLVLLTESEAEVPDPSAPDPEVPADETPEATPAPDETPEAHSLENTRWLLTEYVGETGEMQPAVAEVEAFMVLANGEVAGNSGCNSFGGSAQYEIDGDSIVFGEVVSTLMACPGERMDQEQVFLAALSAATNYALSDATLTLLDNAGTPLLVFMAQPAEDAAPEDEVSPTAALEDTNWQLSQFADEAGELQPAVAEADAFLLLQDGEVTGHTGCNSFGSDAPYRLDGDTLVFGTFITTEIACSPEIMEQEQAIFAALSATRSYAITADTLTLLDEAGAPLLVFLAAPADEMIALDPASTTVSSADANTPVSDLDAALEDASPALEDFTWALLEYRNRQGELVEPADEGELLLSGGNMSGNTGCNTMNSNYYTEEDRLSFSVIATTRMGCPPDRAAQEFDVLNALAAVTGYALEDETLTLVDAAGEAVLVYGP